MGWGQIIPGRRVWKTTLAATAAWEIAVQLGADHPFFAPLAAVLCMQATVEKSLTKGFQRVLGIIIGVLLASAFSLVAIPSSWSIGIILLIALSVARGFRLPEYTVTQTGISTLLVFIIGSDSNFYGIDRILETIIGAAVATAVNLLIAPPDYTKRFAEALETASTGLVQHYDNLSKWVEEGATLPAGKLIWRTTDQLCEDIKQASVQMELATLALKYSPFVRRRHSRLEQYQKLLQIVEKGYLHSRELQRILLALVADRGLTAKDQVQWTLRFAQFAAQIDDWWRQVVDRDGLQAPRQQVELAAIPSLTEQHYQYALEVEASQLLDDFGHNLGGQDCSSSELRTNDVENYNGGVKHDPRGKRN
ncbi:FUSC family protein [Paenibacillus agricola]|uniref:Aromatic acid exporter family protein n=1 Tax=Paenibacillus agricola TaxID=2716264 RepID=A0ABX0J774_9BACL|nr:FUSC family protein [Paenibacillus agricola]NHN31458.1 aromatic acid exporter family protein [Paenibacillus agricola]